MEVSEFRSKGKGRRLWRYSVDLFISMLRQIKQQPNFQYKVNQQDVRAWDAFALYWGANKLGEEFIRKWTEYQFQSWFNDGTERDYNHAVRMSWIFNGTTAVKRWKALDAEARSAVVRKSLKKDFSVRTRSVSSFRAALLTAVRDAEETCKAEFYGTKRGLLWCVANTTLYNHRSSLCVVCANKEDCLITLKREYPHVAQIRGYGKQESKQK